MRARAAPSQQSKRHNVMFSSECAFSCGRTTKFGVEASACCWCYQIYSKNSGGLQHVKPESLDKSPQQRNLKPNFGEIIKKILIYVIWGNSPMNSCQNFRILVLIILQSIFYLIITFKPIAAHLDTPLLAYICGSFMIVMWSTKKKLLFSSYVLQVYIYL